MLFSVACILLFGLSFSWVFQKIHLPGLLGMLLAGIALGPYGLNFLSEDLLNIGPDLRRIALVVILFRAGLALNWEDLKKIGKPAFLLSFVPASCEIIGATIFAPRFLNVSILDAAIIGTVLAAVSPAVIVPRMLCLMEKGYGVKKRIPQMLLAGSSVDDIYVIVLFSAFISMAAGQTTQTSSSFLVLIAIISGIVAGIILGWITIRWFQRHHQRDTVKFLILLSISFLLLSFEEAVPSVPFSGLLAILTIGMMICGLYPKLAERLSGKFSKAWVAAELFLFVLIGAVVNPDYLFSAGVPILAVVFFALLFRLAGVWLSVWKTPLTRKEKIFCGVSYLPKATVQAAIGAIPLNMGLQCGETVLTVAVLSILFTAPLGAVAIDHLHQRLLQKDF